MRWMKWAGLAAAILTDRFLFFNMGDNCFQKYCGQWG